MSVRQNLSSLTVGAIVGVDYVTHGIALASIIFVGALAPNLSLGVTLFLASTVVINLVMIWRGPLPGSCSMAQDVTVPILAPAVAAAVIGLSAGTPEQQLATAIAIIALSTLGSGVAFFLAGWLKASSYFKLIPYPVLAGFMAGTGWLFLYAATSLVTSGKGVGDWSAIADTGPKQVQLALTVLLAVGMVLADKFIRLPNAPLLLLLTAFALFFVVLPLFGLTLKDAVELGLMAGQGRGAAQADAVASASYGPELLLHVNWTQVSWAAPAIVAAISLNFISFGLNHSGAEMALRHRIDLNSAFRVSGITNTLLGAFGGVASYIGIGSTVMAHRLGARNPYLAIGVLTVVVMALLFAATIVSLVPKFISAALLAFMGLLLIYQWVVSVRRHLELNEWLIVLAILAVTIIFGFLPALLFGCLLAALLFVVTTGRIGVIGGGKPGAAPRSTLRRGAKDEQLLVSQAGRIQVVRLRGFLFFGSAEAVRERVETLIQNQNQNQNQVHVEFIVMDCTQVLGVDATALQTLFRLGEWAVSEQVVLILSGINGNFQSRLDRLDNPLPPFSVGAGHGLFVALDLDRALERCEDTILYKSAGPNEIAQAPFLTDELASIDGVQALFAAKSKILFPAGTTVIEKGGNDQEMYIIASGRIDVWAELDGQHPGRRLASFLAGSVLGDVAFYNDTPRSAYAITVEPTELFVFTAEEIEALEQSDPRAAIAFHRFAAAGLASKLLRAT